MPGNGIYGGKCGYDRTIGGFLDLYVDATFEGVDLFSAQDAFTQEPQLHLGDGVTQGVGGELFGCAVVALVLAHGVGVGADDVAVDKRGTLASAAVGYGFDHCGVARDGIGTVDFCEVEVGEVCDET